MKELSIDDAVKLAKKVDDWKKTKDTYNGKIPNSDLCVKVSNGTKSVEEEHMPSHSINIDYCTLKIRFKRQEIFYYVAEKSPYHNSFSKEYHRLLSLYSSIEKELSENRNIRKGLQQARDLLANI